MKYAIICASTEPTYCGVGKFSAKITKLLQKHGVEVVYLTSTKQRDAREDSNHASIKTEKGNLLSYGLLDIHKFIRKHRPNIVNLQYQSFHQNYWDMLFPLIIKIAHPKTKIISTIHEFAQFSWKGKIRQLLPMIASDRVLFSDKRQFVTAMNYTRGVIKKKSDIIKVGPSVKQTFPRYNPHHSHNSNHLHIAFHGFIQPQKGLDYLLAGLTNFKHPYTLHILGKFEPLLEYSTHDTVYTYQQTLLEYINSHPVLKENIVIHGDVDPTSQTFIEILKPIELAIFPFRDGVSHRRSSLFNTFMLSNCLVAATFDTTYSDEDLSALIPLDYSSESITNFLNEYIGWNNVKREETYQKQKKLKEKLLSSQFEQEVYTQLTSV